jgi:hypothetical protein
MVFRIWVLIENQGLRIWLLEARESCFSIEAESGRTWSLPLPDMIFRKGEPCVRPYLEVEFTSTPLKIVHMRKPCIEDKV